MRQQKYQVGDKVRIRRDLKTQFRYYNEGTRIRSYSNVATEGMVELGAK